MRLNNRQKSLLIQVLSEEWSKVSWLEFSLSTEDRKFRSKDFNKRWDEVVQKRKGIETIIDLCNDEISKNVYFLPIKLKTEKEIDEKYHEIMSNR